MLLKTKAKNAKCRGLLYKYNSTEGNAENNNSNNTFNNMKQQHLPTQGPWEGHYRLVKKREVQSKHQADCAVNHNRKPLEEGGKAKPYEKVR